MRSVLVLLALIASVYAAPASSTPANGDVIGPCDVGEALGTTKCDGTGFTKCGHRGHFFFDCGPGTACLKLTDTSVTCGNPS